MNRFAKQYLAISAIALSTATGSAALGLIYHIPSMGVLTGISAVLTRSNTRRFNRANQNIGNLICEAEEEIKTFCEENEMEYEMKFSHEKQEYSAKLKGDEYNNFVTISLKGNNPFFISHREKGLEPLIETFSEKGYGTGELCFSKKT